MLPGTVQADIGFGIMESGFGFSCVPVAMISVASLLDRRALTALAVALPTVAACGDPPVAPGEKVDPTASLQCNLNDTFLAATGVARDGIPALTDPPMVTVEDPAAIAYLESDALVVGLVLDGDPIAIPHNILVHHEIVNLNGLQTQVAVTYCPLTGSALVFDRASVNGAELRVSGLLYQSNLILYDRTTNNESFWPQMFGEARCGPRSGAVLERASAIEMTWESWTAFYPQTKVVSEETGFDRNYLASGNPYSNYEASETFWFKMPAMDRRRPQKERVFGIPATASSPAIAFPFGPLAQLGRRAVIEVTVDGEPAVVLWDADARTAGAYRPLVSGEPVTLTVSGLLFEDEESGSLWHVDGTARVGPKVGLQMEPIDAGYIAYWGAWAAFHPESELWTAP